MKRSSIAYFGLGVAAVFLMGQAAIQTFPPQSVFGRLGVGTYGPGGAIPISTLTANLGLGAPNHAVVLGTGASGSSYGSAAPSAAGQILIDQGSGVDPAFKPMSGSCTISAAGATSCSGVGAGVTSVTGDYTALATDCLKTIAAGGNAQITITVNAASTYGACTLDITNVDSWGTGAGKKLSVSGLTTNPTVLYPGMTITLLNVNNSWVQKPGLATAQAPLGTKLYVDGVNGDDGNDCLATTTACRTLNWVMMHVIWGTLAASAGSGTGLNPGFDVRLIADPGCAPSTGLNCIGGLHFSGYPKQIEGHNSIMIQCDSGSAVNCTIADNSGNAAIGCFVPLNLELKNVTLSGGSAGNNAVQAERCMVRMEGGVVLGNTGSSPQLAALNQGIIVQEATTVLTVNGSGGYLAQAQSGGIIQLDQAAIQWAADSTYSGSTLNANLFSAISANGTSWQLLGHTVTATFNIACGPGGIVYTGGTIASVPGTNAQSGCAASANGQVN